MVLVIRAKIIDYDYSVIEGLINETLRKAFKDGKKAKVKEPVSGSS